MKDWCGLWVTRTAYEEAFDGLTREASRLLGAPVALLNLVDEYSDFVKSHVGLPEPYATTQEIADHPTFCQLTVAQAEPLAINDTREVAMLRFFPSVQRMGVRAHLGVPLSCGWLCNRKLLRDGFSASVMDTG